MFWGLKLSWPHPSNPCLAPGNSSVACPLQLHTLSPSHFCPAWFRMGKSSVGGCGDSLYVTHSFLFQFFLMHLHLLGLGNTAGHRSLLPQRGSIAYSSTNSEARCCGSLPCLRTWSDSKQPSALAPDLTVGNTACSQGTEEGLEGGKKFFRCQRDDLVWSIYL
jgi:hypothetical protein